MGQIGLRTGYDYVTFDGKILSGQAHLRGIARFRDHYWATIPADAHAGESYPFNIN
jgi:hypothetical protein